MFEQAQNDIVGFQAVFHSSSLEAAAGKRKNFPEHSQVISLVAA